MSNSGLVRIVGKSGRSIKAVPLPERFAPWESSQSLLEEDSGDTEIISSLFDLKVMRDPSTLKGPIPGRPAYGTCHVCSSQMPLFIGLRRGNPWSFYYCPGCDKYYKYK